MTPFGRDLKLICTQTSYDGVCHVDSHGNELILGISGISGSATQRIGDGYTVDINLSS